MSQVVTSITIAASPEDVYDFVMDPTRLEEWVSIHRGLGKHSDSEMEQKLCLRGVNFEVKWKLVGAERPSHIEWHGKGPARSRAETEYHLESDGNGGTRFDYRNEFKAPLGPLGAVASRALVGGIPEKEAKASLASLKRLLEA